MEPIPLPSSKSVITLQDISLDNWKKVSSLVVNKDQTTLVNSNIESLCEHQFCIPKSIVQAIVADNTPVGYVRIQLQDQTNSQEQESYYLLINFMIDQACQGLGFGTKAMKLLQKHVLTLQGNPRIKILMKPFETVHPEDSPEHFFAGLGFVKSKNIQNQDVMTWTP